MTTSPFEIKTSHYIIGAVALTAALSWNSAIRESINKCFPLPKEEIVANFVYAVIITIFLILLIEYLPNTTSELPKSTQEKIKTAETMETLMNRLTRLEFMVGRKNLALKLPSSHSTQYQKYP
jgi:hypothetical protein